MFRRCALPYDATPLSPEFSVPIADAPSASASPSAPSQSSASESAGDVWSDWSAWRRVVVVLLTVVAGLMVVAGLQATHTVSLPLVFGFFATLLLLPVQHFVNHRLPGDRFRWVGTMAAMAVFLITLAAMAGTLILIFYTLRAGNIEGYQRSITSGLGQVQTWIQSNLGLDIQSGQASTWERYGDRITGWVRTGMYTGLGLTVFLVLVFFFTMLMLLEAHLWNDKVRDVFTSPRARKVVDAVDASARKVRQYLWVRTKVSMISGLAHVAFLWAMGVDFWWVWGIVAFAFNYVPNIGSILSAIPPILVAWADPNGGLWWAAAVAGGLFVMEQVIGNLVDPKLQGKALSLSPLVVLVGLLFWSWVWGVGGALLAVPITATLVVICAHIPSLVPIAEMLRSSPDDDVAPESGTAEV